MSNCIIDYLAPYADGTFVKEAGFFRRLIGKNFLKLPLANKFPKYKSEDAFNNLAQRIANVSDKHNWYRYAVGNSLRKLKLADGKLGSAVRITNADVPSFLMTADMPPKMRMRSVIDFATRKGELPVPISNKYTQKMQEKMYRRELDTNQYIRGLDELLDWQRGLNRTQSSLNRLESLQRGLNYVAHSGGVSTPKSVKGFLSYTSSNTPRYELRGMSGYKPSTITSPMNENIANAIQKDTAWHATLPKLSGSATRDGSFMYPTPNTLRALSGLGF